MPPNRASLSRTQDRAGWSVIFRHPALIDRRTGKRGKRVRYGLGTRDDNRAAQMVAELNELLADERWWSPTSRAAATNRFDRRVVEIFFDSLEVAPADARQTRERLMPLPAASDWYRRVLLLGTTGAGKTTLLRQLIGTDPDTERFPTTATGRTTIADTEVITRPGPYEAVVTFYPFDEVREHLADCVFNAVLAAHRGEERDAVQRALLQHPDQRFRFNYVLGDGWPAPGRQADVVPAEASDLRPAATGMSELGDIDLEATRDLIGDVVDRVMAIASTQAKTLRDQLESTTGEDQRLIDEIFEEEIDALLRDDERIHELVDGLLDQMHARFDLITVGSLSRSAQGWPDSWQWKHDDRIAFIRQMRRFTSNAKVGFGRLLTPLVNGVRVAGEFAPTWHAGPPPALVLMDTEGLGHTPDSASSMPTRFTDLVDEVDAVVLVDNAQQPMQAAPAAVLRALARTGHAAKLHLCFTHLDQVTGDNMPTDVDKAIHVLNSCNPVLTSIGKELGLFAERPLRARIRDASYFISDAHRRLGSGESVRHMQRLLEQLAAGTRRAAIAAARPVYDQTILMVAIRDATAAFHEYWRAVLGLGTALGVNKEHWSRIKALSRRFAYRIDDEYLWLRPVAQLQAGLQEEIFKLIQNPVGWRLGQPTDEEQQAFFDDFANRVSRRLLEMARRRIADEQHRGWQDAFTEQGTGSAARRAKIISDDVYTHAAPIPLSVPTADANALLRDIIRAFRETVAELDVELV